MILSIKPGKSDKVHIYIDGEYRMTCDGNFWFSEKWHKLKEINDEELTELEGAVSSRRAFLSGMNLLGRRAHSKKELLIKLSQKFDRNAAENAVAKLEELMLIDDEKFARYYAEELFERKHFAPKRIENELRLKGIDSETARNAVESLDKEDNNRIILLLNSKYKTKLSTEKGVRQAINGLMRMGYAYGDIKKALDEVGCDSEGEDFDG